MDARRLTDADALALVLRDAERRDDHDGVMRACEALLAAGAWLPVRDVAVRVVERAEGSVDARICRGFVSRQMRNLTPEQIDVYERYTRPDHRLARLGANLWRLLGPGAPWGQDRSLCPGPDRCFIPGCRDEGCQSPFPEVTARDVLAGYVGALRLWGPDAMAGWWDWLWLRGNTLRRQGPALAFDGAAGALVHVDGRVECGDVCPPLPAVPAVPAREEVTNG